MNNTWNESCVLVFENFRQRKGKTDGEIQTKTIKVYWRNPSLNATKARKEIAEFCKLKLSGWALKC